MAPCKHPRVQIVAREEDTEFVECLECGEIFESSEFKDMAIEETKLVERILTPPAKVGRSRDKGNLAQVLCACCFHNTLLMSRGE